MNKLLNIHQEAIAPQLNDQAIAMVKTIFGEMREDYLKNYSKNLQTNLDRISAIISKRFGIPIKMLNDEKHVGPWTVTYTFVDERTGFDVTSDIVKDGGNWLMKLLMKNELARIDENKKIFTKYLENNDILVDLNKAYVHGVPKDYDCLISCSWNDLFNDASTWYAANDDMIVGLLLHEIGHVFSRLEYLYKTKSTVLALEEAMRDALKVKNGKGFVFAVAYRKNVNPNFKSEEYKDANVSTVAIGVLKDIKERYDFSRSKRSSVNMEFVADQFATRFGYGEACQEYLYSVTKDGMPYYNNPTRTAGFMVGFIFIIFIFTFIALVGGFSGIVGLIGGTISFMVLNMLNVYKAVSSGSEVEATYDIPYIRTEKAVLDYIRQLRLYGDKLPDKERQRIIKAIDNLQETLKRIKALGGETTHIKQEKVFEFLNGKIKNIRELSEFSENVERLMENKLHVDARRF